MLEDVVKKFEEMGANAQVRVRAPRSPFFARRQQPVPLTVDIIAAKGHEVFDITLDPEFKNRLEFNVLQILPHDRHLVFVARELDEQGRAVNKHHFLCGHDERHWFVAGVSAVSTVNAAKAALKPDEIRHEESRVGLRNRRKNLRRNEAYVRQGEWFFIPCPGLDVDAKMIHKNEPIRRGGRRAGKAHWAELAYRTGGESVKVCYKYPNGLTIPEYESLLKSDPEVGKYPWRDMKRNPTLYAKGRISHPDHATVILSDWHRVLMNTERRTETVAFLD